MRARIWIAALLAALTTATACTGFRQPEIELDSIELGSVGLAGGTLLANVRVTNPNRIGARADWIQYALYLRAPEGGGAGEWERLSEGTFEGPVHVDARETRIVQVPVSFRFAELGAAGRSVLQTGRFDYRAEGRARVSAAGVSREVPFRRTGTVMVGR